MADGSSLSYEDLEPEGGAVEDRARPRRAREFADGELDALMDSLDDYEMGPLGEYEFGDEDEFEYFEHAQGAEFMAEDEFDYDAFYEEPLQDERQARRRDTLAAQAARAALKWGGQANRSPGPKGNGRKRGPGELRSAPVEACSAAVSETQMLMEALASAAAATDNQVEAMGLAATLVPLSIGLEPHAYRALWPSVPALVRGVMGVTRLLHSRPDTRRQIQALPGILWETTAQLAQHALRGRAVPERVAAKVLARETQATFSPQRRRPEPPLKPRRARRQRSRGHDKFGSL